MAPYLQGTETAVSDLSKNGSRVPSMPRTDASLDSVVDTELTFQNPKTEWVDDPGCDLPESAEDDNRDPVKTHCSLQEGCAYGCAAVIAGFFA